MWCTTYADYLPLYRLEEIFTRQGFESRGHANRSGAGDVGGPGGTAL